MNPIQDPNSRTPSAVLAVVIALASAGALLATTGEAQSRERSTTITGANGKTAQRSVDRSAGDVSATTTGPNGKTATRVTTRTGTGSQTTVTGPNGQTGSVTVTHP